MGRTSVMIPLALAQQYHAAHPVIDSPTPESPKREIGKRKRGRQRIVKSRVERMNLLAALRGYIEGGDAVADFQKLRKTHMKFALEFAADRVYGKAIQRVEADTNTTYDMAPDTKALIIAALGLPMQVIDMTSESESVSDKSHSVKYQGNQRSQSGLTHAIAHDTQDGVGQEVPGGGVVEEVDLAPNLRAELTIPILDVPREA